MSADSAASESASRPPIITSSVLDIDPARIVLARRKIAAMGLTIDAWSKQEGYSPRLVYKVLTGRQKCLWGTSLAIANKLGLRDGPAPTGMSFHG